MLLICLTLPVASGPVGGGISEMVRRQSQWEECQPESEPLLLTQVNLWDLMSFSIKQEESYLEGSEELDNVYKGTVLHEKMMSKWQQVLLIWS